MFIRHIIQHQSQCYYLSHIVQIELAQALLLRLTRWNNLPTLKCRSHIYSQVISISCLSSNPISRMNVSDNLSINMSSHLSQAFARLIFLPPRQYQLSQHDNSPSEKISTLNVLVTIPSRMDVSDLLILFRITNNNNQSAYLSKPPQPLPYRKTDNNSQARQQS